MKDTNMQIALKVIERAQKTPMALFKDRGNWRVCRVNDERFMDLSKRPRCRLYGVYNFACPVDWILEDMNV